MVSRAQPGTVSIWNMLAEGLPSKRNIYFCICGVFSEEKANVKNSLKKKKKSEKKVAVSLGPNAANSTHSQAKLSGM